jgi:hypothetical protein
MCTREASNPRSSRTNAHPNTTSHTVARLKSIFHSTFVQADLMQSCPTVPDGFADCLKKRSRQTALRLPRVIVTQTAWDLSLLICQTVQKGVSNLPGSIESTEHYISLRLQCAKKHVLCAFHQQLAFASCQISSTQNRIIPPSTLACCFRRLPRASGLYNP